MAQPEQFGKRTFAVEAAEITTGEATWQDPPEVRLVKVHADGYLHIHGRERLSALPFPWPEAVAHDEVLVEIKMARDHLDELEVERALLRRQARQVQRREEGSTGNNTFRGQVQLWILAPYVPAWLRRTRQLDPVASGCYRVAPSGFPFLWVAANELPLLDELVPFLVARSGRALDDFARWVAPRRSSAWVLDMVESLPMSTAVRDELLLQVAAKKDDPEIEERSLAILQAFLAARPEVRQEIAESALLQGLGHQFERRLGRALTPTERARLSDRVRELGAERVGDVVLDLARDELAAWLAETNGR